MSYNPGNQFIGPQVMSKVLFDQIDEKKRRKENDALVKGFMQMHQASPELQRILPVQDWGDVAPNQIKGWLQGVALQQEEQQRMQQQTQQQLAQQQAAQQQQAQQQALMQVLQGLGGSNTPMTPQANYLSAMVGQGGGGQMDSKQIMEVLGGLAGPRAFDSKQYADTDILLAPTGNVINRGERGASGPPVIAEVNGQPFYKRGGEWFPLREDTGVSNLRPDDILRHERRRRSAAQRIEELQKKADKAWTERGKAEARKEMDELQAEIGAIDSVLSGRRAPAAAPVVAAGPGQTTVAPVDPLIQQAQQYIQQQQGGGGQAPVFGSVQEAEAARAAGYRGVAVINGKRYMIED
jgi:hypothetical protein